MKIGEISKLLNELECLRNAFPDRYSEQDTCKWNVRVYEIPRPTVTKYQLMTKEEIDARIKEIEETDTHRQCVASMMNTPLC